MYDLSPNSVLVGARRLFVLEDTFHNTRGAQPGDNDHDTITEFLRDGQGRRGKIKRVANVQSIESNSMANSHVGKIHLPARARRMEEQRYHHHSFFIPGKAECLVRSLAVGEMTRTGDSGIADSLVIAS